MNIKVPPETMVEEVSEVTPELVEAMGRLVPQLSSSSPNPTSFDLERIVDSPATVLFVARDEGKVVGSLTLAVFLLPTGTRAWIEDVVVDEAGRGRGVGEALVEAAISRSRSLGARTVDLTSRPTREAANRLYLRLGFVARHTNIYRYEIT